MKVPEDLADLVEALVLRRVIDLIVDGAQGRAAR